MTENREITIRKQPSGDDALLLVDVFSQKQATPGWDPEAIDPGTGEPVGPEQGIGEIRDEEGRPYHLRTHEVGALRSPELAGLEDDALRERAIEYVREVYAQEEAANDPPTVDPNVIGDTTTVQL